MFVSAAFCHGSGQSESQAQLLPHNKASFPLISVLSSMIQFLVRIHARLHGLSHAILFPLQLKAPLLALQLRALICHCPLILSAFQFDCSFLTTVLTPQRPYCPLGIRKTTLKQPTWQHVCPSKEVLSLLPSL